MRLLCLLLILIHVSAHADLNEIQKQGLKETESLLQNKAKRDAAVAKDPKAKDMDEKVDALTGGGTNKEDIYAIAAELMDKIAIKANGDPEKMQMMMLKAQQNPKAFYDEFFDEGQKEKARSLAGKISKDKPKTSPSK